MADLSHISEPLRPLAVPIEALRKDPRNARLHPDRNIHAIRLSLARFGQQKPVVLSDDGVTIIAGNGTVEAAGLLGWTHIAAVTSTLSGRDATAYGLADNRTAETAEWDFERVSGLIKELQAYEYDLDALGWQPYELEPILSAEWKPAALEALHEASADTNPSPSAAPETRQSEDGDPDAEPKPSNYANEGAPAEQGDGSRPEWKYIPFTDEQHEVVSLAVGKLREMEQDESISEGRAIELILADWLAGQ